MFIRPKDPEAFAIILFDDDAEIKPLLNYDGTLPIFKTLQKADDKADEVEELSARPLNSEGVGRIKIKARVISIDEMRR